MEPQGETKDLRVDQSEGQITKLGNDLNLKQEQELVIVLGILVAQNLSSNTRI